MKQRVSIARAFANDPEILLMDEPLGALDAQTRAVLQEELIRIWEASRKTVVYITHSIEEAAYLSDHIVLLSARPGTVSQIIQPHIDRGSKSPDEIRRDKHYLDAVDEIWHVLKKYLG